MPSVTHTQTHNTITPANPFLVCARCYAWVDFWHWGGPPINYPCGHRADYVDLCPSWGPVDGCECLAHFGYVPHPPERDRDA